MFDVRPRDGLGILTVIGDNYCNSGIVPSDAINKIFKLIVTQESLCSYRHKGADVVFCRELKEENCLNRKCSKNSWCTILC